MKLVATKKGLATNFICHPSLLLLFLDPRSGITSRIRNTGRKYISTVRNMKELFLLQELAEPRLISMPFVTETTRISLIIPVTEPDSKVHPVVRIQIQLGLWIRIQNLYPSRKAKITKKKIKITGKRTP